MNNSLKENNVQGAERFSAALLFLGEIDLFNLGNIGFVVYDDDGETKRAFAKIDHGRSGTRFFSDSVSMLRYFADTIKKHPIKFRINIDEFLKVMREISKFAPEYISETIKERVNNLQEEGLLSWFRSLYYEKNSGKYLFPVDMTTLEEQQDEDDPLVIRRKYDDLGQFSDEYVRLYKTQLETIQNVVDLLTGISDIHDQVLEIVADNDVDKEFWIKKGWISDESEQEDAWINGGWIDAINQHPNLIEWIEAAEKKLERSLEQDSSLDVFGHNG